MNHPEQDDSQAADAGAAKYHQSGELRDRESDALVVVAETAGELTAEVIQGRLESAGIPSALQYDSMGTSLFPVPSVPLGRVRVLVPRDFAEDAFALLSTEFDPDDTFSEEEDVTADAADAG